MVVFTGEGDVALAKAPMLDRGDNGPKGLVSTCI